MTLKDRVFTAVFALFSFLVFLPQYVSARIIAWTDMLFYFLPFRLLPAELIKQGVLPLWNPYIYCGQPLMANMQSAVLYPMNVLYYVMPADLALKFSTLTVFFLMAFFFYMFARLYKMSEEGSFLAASLFTFTFYMTVRAVELADLNTILWMPAALYFTKKHAAGRKLADLIFAAITLALSFLGGHPQVFSYVYLLFLLFFFYENIRAKNKYVIKNFIVINAAFVMAVLAQALPTAEFILHSRRMSQGNSGLGQSLGGFMHFEQLVEMLFPFTSAYLPNAQSFLNWIGLIDIGSMALFLFALASVKMEDKKLRVFLLALFAFSFFTAFMSSLPFYGFLYKKIFLLKMINYPGRINLIFFFIMCLMSGFGFDLLFKQGKEQVKGFMVFTLATGGALLAAYLALEFGKTAALKIYKTQFNPFISLSKLVDFALLYERFLKDALTFVLMLGAVVMLIYIVAGKGKKNTAMKYAVLSVALLCAVFYHRSGYRIYAPYEYVLKDSGTIKFLKQDKDIGGARVLAPGATDSLNYEIKSDKQEDLFYYIRDCLFPNTLMMHGIMNADGFDSLILGDFFDFKTYLNNQDRPWDDPAFALLNVKYISSLPEIKGKYIKPVFKGWTNLYEYQKPAGPAYFTTEYEKRKATLAGRSAYNNPKTGEWAAFFFPDAGKTILNYKRTGINEFSVDVKTERPGLLTITENYYPGWNAYEGKNKLRIYEMTPFAGVHVDKSCRIDFIFGPKTFIIGMTLSIIMLIMGLIAPILLIKRGIKVG